MERQLNIAEQEDLFKAECKLINLKYEYEGYTGTEKWAIVSELTEEELLEKYPDVITQYTPFVLLSVQVGEIIAEAHRNEDKFEKRAKRRGHIFDTADGDFDNLHTEVAYEPDYVEEIYRNDCRKALLEGITQLTDIQRSRVIQYFYYGKSTLEIAKEEGVNVSKVTKSLHAAIGKLRKFLKTGV